MADRFLINALLGRGGTGDVYRVLDRRTGQSHALKWLRRCDALELSAFEREYHTLRQLSHPNVVRVGEYGVVDGAAYYTMELLEGSDLRDGGALPYRKVCRLLRDVASALAILHSRRLLHRDVSGRNVIWSAKDGRARLLDFGAMTPMGPAGRIVGTAPFVAPEVVQLQTLDGRADLYSLGVLAYQLLTGRQPYPAHSLNELRELWRSRPAPVRASARDVPEALDRLVMELLNLDRSERPSSAAEVIERLSGIAHLSPNEVAATTRAYLTQPALVGRGEALACLRAAMLRGRADPFLIEGESGSGRTRLLEAGLIEAQLAGWVVLRADPSGSTERAFGTLASLYEQLVQVLPELAPPAPIALGVLTSSHGARTNSPSPAPALAAAPANTNTPGAAPSSTGNPAASIGADPASRSAILRELRAYFCACAGAHRVLIAVDDVDAIDEPSRSLLASLVADDGSPRPCLLLSAHATSQATPGSALEVLREHATHIALAPLTLPDTEELLRSVFGDVAHLTGVASSVHALAEGNPGWTMALAEHLVEQHVARYAAGSWALPEQLESADLPASLSAAWRGRIAELPEDARELAAILASTRCESIPPDAFGELTEHGDRARAHRALSELLAAGVLCASEGRYRFRHQGLCSAAATALHAPVAAHARIASVAASLPADRLDPLLAPEHLLCCGREREALQRLDACRCDPSVVFSDRLIAVLERAVPFCEAAGIDAAAELELRVWLIEAAAHLGHEETFKRHAEPLLERLEEDSGVRDLRDLDAMLSTEARLTIALGKAQARFDHERAQLSDRQAPAAAVAALTQARSVPPIVALTQLGRLCSITAGMAGVVQDIALLERLPRLSELATLSPALGVVDTIVRASTHFQRGRFDRAGALFTDVLARVDEPDHAQLDDVQWRATRHAALYTQGVLAAARGQLMAPAWVSELEKVPGHRVNAWRVRMTAELMQGQMEAAIQCRRRAEILHLQDGGELPFPGSTGRIELLAFVYCDDLVGVKRTMERIAATAARYPRWRPTLAIARSHYLRLRGEHAGALTTLESALAALEPTRHLDWGIAAASLPRMLSDLGRHEEAVARGREALDICLREDLSPTYRGVQHALADALVRAGRADEAIPLLTASIDGARAAGTRGMLLGLFYETRARAALSLADEDGFRRFAECCAREFHRGHNPELRGRFARLMREARQEGVELGEETGASSSLTSLSALAHDAIAGDVSSAPLVAAGALAAELSARAPDERAQAGLEALVAQAGARAGALFVFTASDARLLASSEPELLDTQTIGSLREFAASQLNANRATTAQHTGAAAGEVVESWSIAAGRAFARTAVPCARTGALVIAVLEAERGLPLPNPDRALLEAIVCAIPLPHLANLDPTVH